MFRLSGPYKVKESFGCACCSSAALALPSSSPRYGFALSVRSSCVALSPTRIWSTP